jgi:hypothetical protein
MVQYNARWGVWGPRALDLASFTTTLQAALPAGWRIVPGQEVVSPERVTLGPHTPTPEEALAPLDPGSVALEVREGRYAGWVKDFLDAEAARLGATPYITGFVVRLDAPAVLDVAARRALQNAVNSALASYERQGFFGHTRGFSVRPVGEVDAGYAAIDRPAAAPSPGIGTLVAGLAIVAGLFFYSQDKAPQRGRA